MTPADTPRLQHIVASGLIFLAGLAVAWASFNGTPAEAYLFPRLISLAWVGLAGWTFVKALMGRTRVGAGLHVPTLLRLAPGLVVMLILVFWAAEALGFYLGSTIAVFIIVTAYDPAPHAEPKSWGKRVLITLGFMAVIYLLFSTLLGVYTPTGIWF